MLSNSSSQIGRPRRSWGGSGDFIDLSKKLSSLSRNEFQRAIAPFLRALFPSIIEAPDLGHIDTAGIDYVVWSDDYRFPVAIQAKGWEVSADKLGYSQVRQCQHSLVSLSKRADIQVDRYIFVHNRDHQSKTFREGINKLIKQHVKEGTAKKIEIWERRTFLNNVFNAIQDALLVALRKDADRRLALGLELVQSLSDIMPITSVPLALGFAEADQHQLTLRTSSSRLLADPAQLIFSEDESSELITLVIAEFGYGKSTTALRALSMSDTPILFLQGAGLGKTMTSVKEFLFSCLEEAQVLEGFREEDVPILSKVARSVALYLFSTHSSTVRLVVDGLDESPVLARTDGFQVLFNWLRKIHIPVVLTLRTEMWNARLESFRSSQGIRASTNKTRNKRFRLIELLPWEDTQILEFTDAYSVWCDDAEKKARIGQFRKLVAEGRYAEIYGDIPRRPLFLHLVLSSVAENGVSFERVGKGVLFRDWILYKIRRDISNPVALGGPGRVSLSDHHSPDQTIELSWKVMSTAAGQMIQFYNDKMELLETCSFATVIQEVGLARESVNDLGVFLNSLLVPVRKGMPFERQKVRFAHRAFQEFFLAWHLLDEGAPYSSSELPVSVLEWLQTLKTEGVWVQ